MKMANFHGCVIWCQINHQRENHGKPLHVMTLGWIQELIQRPAQIRGVSKFQSLSQTPKIECEIRSLAGVSWRSANGAHMQLSSLFFTVSTWSLHLCTRLLNPNHSHSFWVWPCFKYNPKETTKWLMSLLDSKQYRAKGYQDWRL